MKTTDFRAGFCGREHFGFGPGKNFHERWSAMTEDEKNTFRKEHEEFMHERGFSQDDFFGRKREFSVEAIDQRCEEWLKKTPEEKAEFIEKKKEFMKKIHAHHAHRGFFGQGGFGFGQEEECGENEPETK